MANTADGRAFPEEEPTGKFETDTLDALVARSTEKSAMFNASIDGPPVDSITAPYPAATPPVAISPTQSSPEFLGKSTAVLVLPSEPPPPAPPAPAPPKPVVVADAPQPPPANVEPPRPTVAAPVVRTHRRISARAVAKRRRSVWRHVVKLALLALVVVCQPWWWNVGDLHAHAVTTSTIATK